MLRPYTCGVDDKWSWDGNSGFSFRNERTMSLSSLVFCLGIGYNHGTKDENRFVLRLSPCVTGGPTPPGDL
jgi:hypothetical protein